MSRPWTIKYGYDGHRVPCWEIQGADGAYVATMYSKFEAERIVGVVNGQHEALRKCVEAMGPLIDDPQNVRVEHWHEVAEALSAAREAMR